MTRPLGLSIALLFVLSCLWTESSALLGGEKRSIENCLSSFGGLTPENAQRLERYTEWSDNYEEIPCFSQCYLSEMFSFYHKTAGFDARRIVAHFGQAVYDACKIKLELPEGQNSSCSHAYTGFHCVVGLENDPFIMIENLPNTSKATKSAMKQCLQLVDRVEWSRIVDYRQFPKVEPIPCFTRCFILQLQLFNERTRRWDLEGMRKAMGFPKPEANLRGCSFRRGRNQCMTIYQQFSCLLVAE